MKTQKPATFLLLVRVVHAKRVNPTPPSAGRRPQLTPATGKLPVRHAARRMVSENDLVVTPTAQNAGIARREVVHLASGKS